ncbi:STAS domain-containing protein [Streptacidiphilus anmyonensis]|uniref:STAS domain-containing protein n=1 Tax=Streptacidiphilus anmyonensis TaxID=405782 RepID=UPI000694FDB7|nr:STAS domain-containing protein [Streptacidiphilus anmyonensis]
MRHIDAPIRPGGLDASPRLKAEETEPAAGAAVCSLVGDLDLHTWPIAEAAIHRALASRPSIVCVGMGDVHFCDSTGLNLLVSLHARCADLGAALALLAPSARVGRLLELTDVGSVFPIFPDWRTAAAELRRAD